MSEPTQILLVIVITVLSVLLVFIGVQVFLILREFQESIKKANKMLDDAGIITGAVAKPIASLSEKVTDASGIWGILNWLFQRKKKKETETKEGNERPA